MTDVTTTPEVDLARGLGTVLRAHLEDRGAAAGARQDEGPRSAGRTGRGVPAPASGERRDQRPAYPPIRPILRARAILCRLPS